MVTILKRVVRHQLSVHRIYLDINDTMRLVVLNSSENSVSVILLRISRQRVWTVAVLLAQDKHQRNNQILQPS